jgi:hypothetical protein
MYVVKHHKNQQQQNVKLIEIQQKNNKQQPKKLLRKWVHIHWMWMAWDPRRRGDMPRGPCHGSEARKAEVNIVIVDVRKLQHQDVGCASRHIYYLDPPMDSGPFSVNFEFHSTCKKTQTHKQQKLTIDNKFDCETNIQKHILFQY